MYNQQLTHQHICEHNNKNIEEQRTRYTICPKQDTKFAICCDQCDLNILQVFHILGTIPSTASDILSGTIFGVLFISLILVSDLT